jgi:hypothetical protein
MTTLVVSTTASATIGVLTTDQPYEVFDPTEDAYGAVTFDPRNWNVDEPHHITFEGHDVIVVKTDSGDLDFYVAAEDA